MAKKEKQIIYYSDELNDDFANNNIKRKDIPNDYRYIHRSWLFKVNSFLLKYLLALPILWLVNKVIYRPKFVNKKILKTVKHKGYYIYANHVLPYDPVLIPVMTNIRKSCLIIAGHDLFSINGLINWIARHLGAIPVPNNDYDMQNNFKDAISYHIKKRHRVLIYPEAHIWPYFNGIRHFKPSSLRYPVNDNAPVIVMTTTFKKRKLGRKPKPVIYIDGPFYPDLSLSTQREQIKTLADKVYETMLHHATMDGNEEYIKYVKKSD